MIAASTVPRPAGVICAEPASLAVIYASGTPARVVSFSPALIHGIAPLTAHTQAHKATMSKRRWPKDSAETDKNWYRERCTSLRLHTCSTKLSRTLPLRNFWRFRQRSTVRGLLVTQNSPASSNTISTREATREPKPSDKHEERRVGR